MKNAKSITKGNVTVEYYVEGEGDTIVLIPSRGRGQEDFEDITSLISSQGFKVIRPEFRGIGNSTGPMENVSLYDLADEVAWVLEEENAGPAFLVGHAFGNWIARIVAVKHPELVKGICVLAAAAKGKFKPEISQALADSSNLSLPDEERIKALQTAFFGPEGKPEEWLEGWYEETFALQKEAATLAPQDEWWDAGGEVPILEIRAELDPLAPKERAHEMKEMFGDRVTTVEIQNASHALIPEQPEAVVASLVTYGKVLFNEEFKN